MSESIRGIWRRYWNNPTCEADLHVWTVFFGRRSLCQVILKKGVFRELQGHRLSWFDIGKDLLAPLSRTTEGSAMGSTNWRRKRLGSCYLSHVSLTLSIISPHGAWTTWKSDVWTEDLSQSWSGQQYYYISGQQLAGTEGGSLPALVLPLPDSSNTMSAFSPLKTWRQKKKSPTVHQIKNCQNTAYRLVTNVTNKHRSNTH